MIKHLHLVGLNHKTAPLDLRENYLKKVGDLPQALEKLKALTKECAILSTCNRFEIIYVNDTAVELNDLIEDGQSDLRDHDYHFSDTAAVQHLYEVASSLDSLVVGETEILGQVKSCYEMAESHDCVSTFLHKLFQGALHASKKIHSETALGKGHLSVGSIAVDLCRQVYSHLKEERVLLLGSGDIGRVVL
jgi:glutamyl-tRNA reductase